MHLDKRVLIFCRDFYLKYNFDLIHFHCLQILTASVVDAAQELRIPYIVTVHDGWWLSPHQFLIDGKGKAVDTAGVFAASHDLLQGGEKEMDRRDHLRGCLRQARGILAVSGIFGEVYFLGGLERVFEDEKGGETL